MINTDWKFLIDLANSNELERLHYELQRIGALFNSVLGRHPTIDDYPDDFRDSFVSLLRREAAPPGRRGRRSRSDWERLVLRDSYETKLFIYQVTKRTRGTVDGQVIPKNEKPSDIALQELADNMKRSVDTARDAVRKKPHRKK